MESESLRSECVVNDFPLGLLGGDEEVLLEAHRLTVPVLDSPRHRDQDRGLTPNCTVVNWLGVCNEM